MKIEVKFKTPYAGDSAIKSELGSPGCVIHDEYFDTCHECEIALNASEHLKVEMRKCIDKFVQYDEYITVEFDTELGSAVVVPIK